MTKGYSLANRGEIDIIVDARRGSLGKTNLP
jgi:hypothetical protein